MSRRARHNTSVSLFPFLAVLLCAMGALLVLLVITTRQIRDDAIKQAEAELIAQQPQPIASEEHETIEEWPSWEVDLGLATELETRKWPAPEAAPLQAPKPIFVERDTKPVPPDLTAKLDNLREQIRRLQSRQSGESKDRQEIETQIADIRTEINKRKSVIANAMSALSEFAQKEKTLDSQLTSLAAQAQSLSNELEQQRAKNRSLAEAPRVTPNILKVVPYDGQHGTTRRPILIECSGGTIRFVPEGIELTERDLVGFSVRDNPLLSGVRAAEQYWINEDRATGNRSRPYVLLIVRPDGIPAYYGARQLLQTYKQPFGYELVDQDQELVFPEVDSSAKRVIELAIEQELQLRGASPSVANSLFPDYNPRELQQRLSNGSFVGGGFPDGTPNGQGGSPEGSGVSQDNTGNSKRRFKFVQTSRGLIKVPLDDAEMKDYTRNGDRSSPQESEQAGTNEPPPLNPAIADASRPIGQTSPSGTMNDSSPAINGEAPTSAESATTPSELSPFNEPGTETRENVSDAFKAANAPDAMTAIERERMRKQSPDQRRTGTPSQQSGPVNPWTAQGEGGSSTSGTPDSKAQGQPAPGTTRPNTPTKKMPFERPLNVAISDRAMRIDDRKPIMLPENVETQALMKLTVDELRGRVQDWPSPPDQFYWRPMVKFYVYPNGEQNYERLKPYFEKQGLLSGVKYMGSLPKQEGSRN